MPPPKLADLITTTRRLSLAAWALARYGAPILRPCPLKLCALMEPVISHEGLGQVLRRLITSLAHDLETKG
jgi:hypothetical protein